MTDTMNIFGRTGNLADVNSEGAIYIKKPDEIEAYAWTTATADIDAGDTAFLICNTSTSKHLHIVRAFVRVDVATELDWHFPSYSDSFSGTAVTGIPLNRQKTSSAPPVLAYADETANSQANLFMTNYLHVATNGQTTCSVGQWIDFGGMIVLGYHDSLAVDIGSEPGAFNLALFGYFEADH